MFRQFYSLWALGFWKFSRFQNSHEHALTLGSLGTEVALHIAPRRRDAFWRSLSRRGDDDPVDWEPWRESSGGGEPASSSRTDTSLHVTSSTSWSNTIATLAPHFDTDTSTVGTRLARREERRRTDQISWRAPPPTTPPRNNQLANNVQLSASQHYYNNLFICSCPMNRRLISYEITIKLLMAFSS